MKSLALNISEGMLIDRAQSANRKGSRNENAFDPGEEI